MQMPHFLLYCVHAGNRVRFGSQEYTFAEGQNPKCLDVVRVVSPGNSNFVVSYTIGMLLSNSILNVIISLKLLLRTCYVVM